MKTAATRRTLISITGLTLCALAVGCDQGRDDTPPCSAADCDAGPEPISTVFVDADLFAEVLDWSDPNSGALEAALAAGGTAEAMRSTDDACPGVGADPEIQAASCTSSRDQLVNLMMTQAAKDDGPQCLLVAGVDEKLRVDTHSTGEAKGFESNNGVTQRFSRQGPAGATLITASSKLQLEGEQEDGPDYLESRDAAERIRVMSLCYDDNGRVVADGPAATIRIEAKTPGKTATTNQSTDAHDRGSSVDNRECIAGTGRCIDNTNAWELLEGTLPENLALSRVVSTSTWSLSWKSAIPAILDVADRIARYNFPDYVALRVDRGSRAPWHQRLGAAGGPQTHRAGDRPRQLRRRHRQGASPSWGQ